jgi:hypothetical protein
MPSMAPAQHKPGDIVPSGTPLQTREVFAEGTTPNGDPCQLVRLSPGARLAGSCLTWAGSSYAVLFQSPSLGTTGGRHFPDTPSGYVEARDLFLKWSPEHSPALRSDNPDTLVDESAAKLEARLRSRIDEAETRNATPYIVGLVDGLYTAYDPRDGSVLCTSKKIAGPGSCGYKLLHRKSPYCLIESSLWPTSEPLTVPVIVALHRQILHAQLTSKETPQ